MIRGGNAGRFETAVKARGLLYIQAVYTVRCLSVGHL